GLLETICPKCHSSSLWCSATSGPSQIGLDLPQGAYPSRADGCCSHLARDRSIQMFDVLMVVFTFGFFALAIGYAYACERL
ncbi:MAG TPA: hypothetical protein VFL62_22515, partial [Bradyrhizobium sp.]|uniref:hypothetical protein n=1 Tax=Bradyrhizobium sp. TaxID=376 RepID=UPI002D7F10C6